MPCRRHVPSPPLRGNLRTARWNSVRHPQVAERGIWFARYWTRIATITGVTVERNRTHSVAALVVATYRLLRLLARIATASVEEPRDSKESRRDSMALKWRIAPRGNRRCPNHRSEARKDTRLRYRWPKERAETGGQPRRDPTHPPSSIVLSLTVAFRLLVLVGLLSAPAPPPPPRAPPSVG